MRSEKLGGGSAMGRCSWWCSVKGAVEWDGTAATSPQSSAGSATKTVLVLMVLRAHAPVVIGFAMAVLMESLSWHSRAIAAAYPARRLELPCGNIQPKWTKVLSSPICFITTTALLCHTRNETSGTTESSRLCSDFDQIIDGIHVVVLLLYRAA